AVTGEQIWKFVPPVPAGGAVPAGRGGGRAGAPAAAPQATRGGPPADAAEQDAPAPPVDRGGGRGGADSAGTALRGPVYWPGTAGVAPRIYSTTSLGLAAIDAKTGKLVTSFGEGGFLPNIRPTSPPMIYRNLLMT